MPQGDTEKSAWLANFSAKLPKYAAKYGITGPEVGDVSAGVPFFNYWLAYMVQVQQFSQQVTAYKNELRDGLVSGAPASTQPAPPIPGQVPAVVPPDIFGRASSLGLRIKKHRSYTDADGQDLGLVAAEESLEKSSAKPVFTIRLAGGGHPEIVWTKGGMGGVEIHADRTNSGVFNMVDVNSTPNYLDPAALPAQSTIWKYRLIYRKNDQRVGQWSDDVAIMVHA